MIAMPRNTPIVDASTGLVHIDWQRFFGQLSDSSSLTSGIEVIVAGEIGMSVNATRIIEPTALSNTLSALYTVPSRQRLQITRATLANPTADPRTVSIYLVPAGGAANNSNIIVSSRSIAAGATEVLPEMNHAMKAGDSIYAVADIDAAVSFAVSAAVVL